MNTLYITVIKTTLYLSRFSCSMLKKAAFVRKGRSRNNHVFKNAHNVQGAIEIMCAKSVRRTSVAKTYITQYALYGTCTGKGGEA